MKTKYNKLVRDRIPKIIESDNYKCKYHIANDEEFEEKLHEKLQEEINEFQENPNIDEMADILEVLESLRKYYDMSDDEVRYKKESKRVNRGSFNGKIILDWTKEF